MWCTTRVSAETNSFFSLYTVQFGRIVDKSCFLQLDDIQGQHDPRLRIIGGYHETVEGHASRMLQNKGLNIHHECLHTCLRIRERETPRYPKKC